jgi:hypothetical protein
VCVRRVHAIPTGLHVSSPDIAATHGTRPTMIRIAHDPID